MPDKRHDQFNVQRVIHPGDVVQRLQRRQVMLQGGVLKIRQRPGDHGAQGFW